MKINIKTSIIGSTIAAMVAFCGTSQAQSIFNVSGWGIAGYGNGGSWAVTEGSPGDYTIGGSTLTSGASWGAEFSSVTLAAGQYIELTGQFTITGYVGGTGPFRLGLFNDNGNFAGSTAWTGYLFSPPTGSGAPGGGGEFTGHDAQSWASTYSAYGFGTADANTAGTTNGIGDDTFTFDIKLQQLLAPGYVRMTTSLMGSTNATVYSVGPSINNDNAGAATSNMVYNAVGFYLANNGTAATQLSFSGVQISTTGTVVPEPVSMALLGSGLLGLLLVRRSRK